MVRKCQEMSGNGLRWTGNGQEIAVFGQLLELTVHPALVLTVITWCFQIDLILQPKKFNSGPSLLRCQKKIQVVLLDKSNITKFAFKTFSHVVRYTPEAEQFWPLHMEVFCHFMCVLRLCFWTNPILHCLQVQVNFVTRGEVGQPDMTCVYQDLKQAELNYCNVYIVFGAELLESMLNKGTFQKNYFEEGHLWEDNH